MWSDERLGVGRRGVSSSRGDVSSTASLRPSGVGSVPPFGRRCFLTLSGSASTPRATPTNGATPPVPAEGVARPQLSNKNMDSGPTIWRIG